MIVEVIMFGCDCDNCGERWVDDWHGFAAFTDAISMRDNVADSGDWHTDGNVHYCPKCFTIGDDDEIVVNKERSKEQGVQECDATKLNP